MKRISVSILAFCILLLFADVALGAERKRESRSKNDSKNECRLISSSEAIYKAKSRTGGKVVSIKLRRAGKHSVYRVRVLVVGDKRIKNITIRACR